MPILAPPLPLPLPPETVRVEPETLSSTVREVAQITMEARAADGVIELEVVRDGELLPIHFEGKTVTSTGTGARLELRLTGPVDQDVTTLLIRPISGAGVVGHATLRELHWE